MKTYVLSGVFIMEINSKNLLKNHSVSISGRDKIEILGATEMLSSTDKEIIAKLQDSYIVVLGAGLVVSKLVPEETTLVATGNITGLRYENKLTKKSFLKKVFK